MRIGDGMPRERPELALPIYYYLDVDIVSSSVFKRYAEMRLTRGLVRVVAEDLRLYTICLEEEEIGLFMISYVVASFLVDLLFFDVVTL